MKEAIIREIYEETGLRVNVKRLIGIYSDPVSQVFTYPSGKLIHFITSCFECEVTGGNLKADNTETLDVAFFIKKNSHWIYYLCIPSGYLMLCLASSLLSSGNQKSPNL